MSMGDLASMVRSRMLSDRFAHLWVRGTIGDFDSSGVGGLRVVVTSEPIAAWHSQGSTSCWVGYFNNECDLEYLRECLIAAEAELRERFD